jgi:hypothetical protein
MTLPSISQKIRQRAQGLVGLAGDRPGVGKSTAAAYLVESLGFQELSIGSLVKSELDEMLSVHGFTYNENEKEYFRPALSWWTDFRLSRCSPDYWLDAALKVAPTGRSVLFSDIRYPNEADYVKAQGGLLIKIQRDSVRRNSESTETALDHYDFEHVVSNDADDGGAAMLSSIIELLRNHGIIKE